MSDYFVKYILKARHRGDTHPHCNLDNDNRTDFKSVHISLWNLCSNCLSTIPFHKGYSCNHLVKKGTLQWIRSDLINQI